MSNTHSRAFKREPRLVAILRETRGALSSLVRQPRYSVPAALSIALGVGASLAVFAVFSALLLRPLPYPEPDRLVRVGFAGAFEYAGPDELMLSFPLVQRLRAHDSVFESLTAQRIYSARLQMPGEPAEWVSTNKTEPELFDTLGVQAEEGRVYSARDPDTGPGIVMRRGYWRDALRGRPQLGQVLLLDGIPRPFIGLIADEQALPSWAGLWIRSPIGDQSPDENFYYQAYARLAPGVTLPMAEERIRALTEDLDVKNPAGDRLRLELHPLRDTLVDAERSWLSLMLAAVLSFLLMSCANLAALLATRAAVRRQEWAVCKALGATHGVLARQCLLEGFVLAVLSGLLGLGLAKLGVDWANREYADVLGNLPARLDLRVLLALVVLVLFCTTFGSAAPVLALRRVAPMDALRADGRSSEGPGARRSRQILVVVQVAATVVLLINAGLSLRSLGALLDRDTGFSTEEGIMAAKVVLAAPPHQNNLPTFLAQKAEVDRQSRALLERLRRLPGVTHVGIGRVPFDYASERRRMQLERGATLPEADVRIHSIGPGYLETLGIELLSGQDFGPEHEAWPPWRFALVSRSFAQEALGVPDAVGHQLRPKLSEDIPWMQIVGMVEDSLEEPLSGPVPLNVYIPFLAYPNRGVNSGNVVLSLSLKVSMPVDSMMQPLRNAVAEVLPEAPVTEVTTLRALVRNSIGRRLALADVLSALAAIALVLGAIGLAGITSHSVARRLQELAIRRALGATQRSVRLLVMRETGSLVGIGTLLGMSGAILSRELMASFVHGIGAIDPLTYLGVAAAALGIAIGAGLIATRPIADLSPARALAKQ
jgi:putative ABC transport system permease protein